MFAFIALAIENEEKQLYGVQFHPEVDLTENGSDIFRNFLFKVRGVLIHLISYAFY